MVREGRPTRSREWATFGQVGHQAPQPARNHGHRARCAGDRGDDHRPGLDRGHVVRLGPLPFRLQHPDRRPAAAGHRRRAHRRRRHLVEPVVRLPGPADLRADHPSAGRPGPLPRSPRTGPTGRHHRHPRPRRDPHRLRGGTAVGDLPAVAQRHPVRHDRPAVRTGHRVLRLHPAVAVVHRRLPQHGAHLRSHRRGVHALRLRRAAVPEPRPRHDPRRAVAPVHDPRRSRAGASGAPTGWSATRSRCRRQT